MVSFYQKKILYQKKKKQFSYRHALNDYSHRKQYKDNNRLRLLVNFWTDKNKPQYIQSHDKQAAEK